MAFIAKTLKDLKMDVIRELNDFGEEDWLDASLDNSATTFTATDSLFKQYKIGTTIEIDEELMRITATATSTTVAIRRGVRGTTAATHSDNEIIRISPKYFQAEIKTYINACIESELQTDTVNDATTTTAAETYFFDLPAAINADNLRSVFVRSSNTDASARTEDKLVGWWVNRGQGTAGVDQIEFPYVVSPAGLYIKYVYRTNFTFLTSDSDTCDLPVNATAHRLPVLYACAQLLRIKDAHRNRRDRNSYPDGATPMTARKHTADWYIEEFKRLRQQEHLLPVRALPRLVRSN